MPAFVIQRRTLTAGAETEVKPPRACQTVTIGNASADDVKVYTAAGDDANNYAIVGAGYEKQYPPLPGAGCQFDPYQVAFYLKSAVGGSVVLTWL